MPINDPKFIISEDIYNKCSQFGKDSVGTSTDKYARRNQFNPDKIIKDIRNGKIGEFGVYSKVLETYPKLSEPDCNIYDKKNKNWDPDLKDEASTLRLAVKSQDIESAIHFGESWVFQIGNGKWDCDTGIFGKDIDPNHYVSFVALNVPRRVGIIKGIVKIQWLHDNKLFKPMQLKSLQNNKVAVYMDDLEKFKDQLWQL